MRRETDQFVYLVEPTLIGSHCYQPGEMADAGSRERAIKMADVEPIICFGVVDAVAWSSDYEQYKEDPNNSDFCSELRCFFHAIRRRGEELGGDWKVVADSLIAS